MRRMALRLPPLPAAFAIVAVVGVARAMADDDDEPMVRMASKKAAMTESCVIVLDTGESDDLAEVTTTSSNKVHRKQVRCRSQKKHH